MIIIQKFSHSGCHYEYLRQTMVERQLRPNGITDERLLNAFLAVKRENFVFPQQRDSCYSDHLTPLKSGRYMLPALSLARIIQTMALPTSSKILVIACGLGYSLEILHHYGMLPTGFETPLFAQIWNKNAHQTSGCIVESGMHSALDDHEYDAILIEGAVEQIPLLLTMRLKNEGTLGCIIFDEKKTHSVGQIFKKTDDKLHVVTHFEACGYMLNEFCVSPAFNF